MTWTTAVAFLAGMAAGVGLVHASGWLIVRLDAVLADDELEDPHDDYEVSA